MIMEYLSPSLVQKTLPEPESARMALRGCSQRVPAEASQRYFAGRRAGRSEVRASTLWVKHGIESRLDLPEGVDAVIPSGFSGAWRCYAGKMAIHSDQMKSHVVPTRFWRRASVLYKAMPKGRVMRRICEAVSGSTDLWDGSRAVVGSSLKVRNAKPF
jgi:hypothetical protein